MKVLKEVGNICLVFLAVIAMLVSIGFAYYHFFIHDTTIGVNNINDQLGLDVKKEDELTEQEKDEFEDRYFIHANYYSNDKKNGIELQELQYNYFTSYRLQQIDYRSTGMQFMGNFKTYTTNSGSKKGANNKVLNEFCYYDTTNGISWNGYKGQYGSIGTTLDRNAQFIIKIDDRAFSIQLTGQYKTGWWIFGTTTYFDFGDVFDCVFSAIKSNSKGYGDYYITLDLSKYFSVKEYDINTGKFKADNVTDVIKNYSVLKFHYDENGAKNSTQSIFGVIDCNSKYNVEDTNIDTSYSQERITYNLTESAKINNKEIIGFRYSEIYNGYFLSLTMETKQIFKDMPRSKVKFILDLQSQYLLDKKINIIGFDYNAFENFEIDTFTIKGNAQILYLLDKSFYNTKLQILKYSNGITFDIAKDAFNNDYTEVVL